MDRSPILVWLRRDLRLADHPALDAAAGRGGPVVPVFVLDENQPHQPGGAARWWLHQSLTALAEAMAMRGGALILRRGDTVAELSRLAAETGARTVLWNRRYEPQERALEARVTAALRAEGIETADFPGTLLFEPRALRNREGRPFAMFSAFWNAALAQPPPPAPLPPPPRLTAPERPVPGLALDALGLFPDRDWWRGLAETFTPGEAGATSRFAAFLEHGLDQYHLLRDRADLDATSRLSPHLAFGEISPRQIWHALAARQSPGTESFLRELGWREFSAHLLDANPTLPDLPLRPEFANFPWQPDARLLAAWSAGRTGFPMVDAGMRQLRRTGWMHNRVRMIVGSFLVKDLLTPWQIGESWFWDNLVDADLANNAASWQWVAGCGIDAAPYFRVFNPVLQGEKFDPRGRYVRQWLPELARLPDLYIHRPWGAPSAVAAAAGLKHGDYPRPVVEHGAARRLALAAFAQLKAPPTPDA